MLASRSYRLVLRSLALLLAAMLLVSPVNGDAVVGNEPRVYELPKGRRKNRGGTAVVTNPSPPMNAANNQESKLMKDLSRSFDKISSLASGSDAVSVTVQIRFDNFASDNSWNIADEANSVIIASGSGYSDGLKNVTQIIPVTLGATYRFNMFDSYGDGLRNGYFAVFFGNKPTNIDDLLVYNDQFVSDVMGSRQDSVVFTTTRPLTPAPTVAPPSLYPQPTYAPTSCNEEGDDFSVLASPFSSRPVIKNAKNVFPLTNDFCTNKLNYRDCTNEFREDCQWIFLPSSRSKGKCRIDPISKCLKIGNCVCNTEDFHGGSGDYANGIVFHVPISVTARDISKFANLLTYAEYYWTPTNNANTKHPHDENFFISKVDFTSRQLTYNFEVTSPLYNGIGSGYTIAFKLHYLYMDMPLVGTIMSGLGMNVTIDTSGSYQVISINQKRYILPRPLKIWTCTSVVITPTTLFVAGNAITRVVGVESPSPTNTHDLTLGNFPGELFDVRVYSGTLSASQIRRVGAKCTNPNDPAAMKVSRDLDLYYDRNGCDSRIRLYVTEPTTGGQTYGSGPFATLWVAPKENPFVAGIFYDIPEGTPDYEHKSFHPVLDVEYFFQHKKLQTYLWEKYYFESDMISFPMEPYRYFKNTSQVPKFAASVWNNPCRYLNQNNNLWDFPLYNTDYVPKWVAKSSDEVFDLRDMFYKHGGPGYQYVAHEMFHEFQQTLYLTYSSSMSWFLSESGASSGPSLTFPGTNVIYASLPLAISYPLGFENPPSSATANAHFLTPELSFSGAISVGHLYNSWILWWFLAEHAGMPHLGGQMYSNEKYTAGYYNGVLSMVRMYVEGEGMDLGDVWSIFVAHYRTWDFLMGDVFIIAEASDFDNTLKNTNPPLPSNTTLENRKTTVYLSPTSGTLANWVRGPMALRPGPFGWNCLTMNGVAANRFVMIDVAWSDGMGFQINTNPPALPVQQKGCDNDLRFYNSMVVVHTPSTGERRYWKVKGKTPATVVIGTGSTGPVTIYILLIPTPPTDYAGGRYKATNTFMYPIPIYEYQYKVSVSSSLPSGYVQSPQEPTKNGIVTFAPATKGYWSVNCTCIDDPAGVGNACVDPVFFSSPITTPTIRPTIPPANTPTTISLTKVPTTNALTKAPTTIAPTKTPTTNTPTKSPKTTSPTKSPTTTAPTRVPTTIAPTKKAPTRNPTKKAPTRAPFKKAATRVPTKVFLFDSGATRKPTLNAQSSASLISTTKSPTKKKSGSVPAGIFHNIFQLQPTVLVAHQKNNGRLGTRQESN